MRLRSPRSTRRTAAALVETAAVVSVFMMVMFGVLEYCRFIFMRQIIDNAAREGARFAVVNTNDPTLDADTTAVIMTKMNNQDKQLQNFTITLGAADSNGNYYTPNQSMSTAPFGKYLAVTVSGNYTPITPAFLRMGKTIPITVKILMTSEAN
jgi:Flp pilus assembly protein TadG